MDLTTHWNTPGLEIQTVTAAEACAICGLRTTEAMFAFYEHVALAVPCQTWLLCKDCAAAVVTQLERSTLRTPLRIRIAVGLVAAERRPHRTPTILDSEFWEEMSDQRMNRLLAAFVLFMFLMPPLVFLLITAFAAFGPGGH